MRWEQEYEHRRDMGHTWGLGIADTQGLTEEERREEQRGFEDYQKKLEYYRVAPRTEYLKAGQALKAALPDHKSIIYGTAPFHWREKNSSAQIALCKKAAESLGYSLILQPDTFRVPGRFAFQVRQYVFLPDRGGNLHPYIVSGIQSLQDCLQLVSDFVAIGQHPTTYFDRTFLFSCDDTGRLRMELESWSRSNGIPLPYNHPKSFAHMLQTASSKAEDISCKHSFTRSTLTHSTLVPNYPNGKDER